jgi:hypothetical protein
VSLFDYELIVGDDGKRLLAFGKFAGRAGLIDFLHGLGQSKYRAVFLSSCIHSMILFFSYLDFLSCFIIGTG